MGLLSELTASTSSTKKASDGVLLLHGLMLMAGADGVIEDTEWDVLKTYWFTLPDFQGKVFDEVLTEVNKVVAGYGELQDSVEALAGIEDEATRRKLFVLAADLAMSSGHVDEAEDQQLETMQRLLGIDDELAGRVLEVLAMKYAR